MVVLRTPKLRNKGSGNMIVEAVWSKIFGPHADANSIAWGPSGAACARYVTTYLDNTLWSARVPVLEPTIRGADCLLVNSEADMGAVAQVLKRYKRIAFSEFRGFEPTQKHQYYRMFTGPLIDQILALDSLHRERLVPSRLMQHAATAFATTHLPRYFAAVAMRTAVVCWDLSRNPLSSTDFLECDKTLLRKIIVDNARKVARRTRGHGLTHLYLMWDLGQFGSRFYFRFYKSSWLRRTTLDVTTAVRAEGVTLVSYSTPTLQTDPALLAANPILADTGAVFLVEAEVAQRASRLYNVATGSSTGYVVKKFDAKHAPSNESVRLRIDYDSWLSRSLADDIDSHNMFSKLN